MKKYKDFRVSVGDDPDHEDLTAEIYFRDYFVAMLTQEQGFDKLQIEIFQNPNGDAWTFLLEDFLKIIELSKQRLWNLRKIEQDSTPAGEEKL
ncbi:MAG: hypothetical protein D3909_07235 [Candidatus Electrothrix sp. ATG1]|nr:hypothetical protein [Candidatus Electrothrix sp. ATG1]